MKTEQLLSELQQGTLVEFCMDGRDPDTVVANQDWPAVVQAAAQCSSSSSSNLQRLVVANIKLGGPAEHGLVQLLSSLSSSSSSSSSLQSVTLQALHLTASNTRALAQALPHTLQELSLAHNPSLGPRGIKLWCEYYLKKQQQQQQQLQAGATLQRLDCTATAMGHFGAQALGLVLPTSLVALHLSHNKLGADGVWKMANRLPRLRQLQFLDLSYNDIGNDGCLELARNLVPLVDNENSNNDNTSSSSSSPVLLQTLKLAGNGIQDGGLAELIKVLPRLVNLQNMDLSHNKLANGAAKQLSSVLRKCPGLETLDLSHNQIGDSGCVSLVEALLPPEDEDDDEEEDSECESDLQDGQEGRISEELSLGEYHVDGLRQQQSRLYELRLNHNVIGDEGAGALVEHLDQIVALQTVTLLENHISDARMRILDMLLKHRTSVASARKSFTTEASLTPDPSEREEDGSIAPKETPTKKQEKKPSLDRAEIEKGREILVSGLSSDEDDTVPQLPMSYLLHITENWSKEVRSHGAFGTLFSAVDRETETEEEGATWLVRKLQLSSAGKMEAIRGAVLAELPHLRHDSLAPLVGIAMDHGTFAFVYDLPEKAALPLRQCLTSPEYRKAFTWPLRLHVACCVAEVLEFLHRNSPGRKAALHGDLQVDEIYVSSDFEQVHVLDAGMSRLLATDRSRFATGDVVYGSRAYRCPRYERGSMAYDASCDMFSLGVMFSELMTSILQRSKKSKSDLAYDVFYECVLARQPLRTDPAAGPVSKLLLQTWGQLTLACLNPLPGQRPTASTAVQILKELRALESARK